MAGRITLIIAYPLGTVVNADQIAVVEEGRFTGTMAHQTLLDNHAL